MMNLAINKIIIKTLLFIIMCCDGFLVFSAGKHQFSEFDCSMPIILSPILREIRNENNNGKQHAVSPQKCKIKNLSFDLSAFACKKDESIAYDKCTVINYKKPQNTFKLYLKNNIVSKIEQTDSEGKTTVYKQTILKKINTMKFDNESYLHMTRKTLLQIYSNECVLLNIGKGNIRATIELTIDTEVDMGIIKFPDYDSEYRFCYYKGRMENAALISENEKMEKIIFSITVIRGNVVFSNVYDNDVKNGFDCEFYKNMGLKSYLPMNNGQFGDVTTWSLNGIDVRTLPLNVWQRQKI